MTQATSVNSSSGNLMPSTPIRISGGSGSSFHGGSAGASGSSPSAVAAHLSHQSETSSPGGGGGSVSSIAAATHQQQQQSSSVHSSALGSSSGVHLQSAGSTTTTLGGSSHQSSLGPPASSVGTISMHSTSTSITPPNSAGLRQPGAFDFKFMRRTSLKVLLPKLPSTDSLSNSPGPSSPGLANWASESRDKYDGNQNDKAQTDTSKLNRKESYKAQRKNYRREKKRVASELLNSLQDPAVIVLADWLKVRGTLKSWTKLWCVLKPGLLLLYKSPKTKSSHWVGTILLTSCQVIERPSKKDGFCFKLFHPLEQSIWAPRGPDKETIGAVVQPLPTAYLIFRAPSQAAGKCWMDALELSLRCSALLLRSNSNTGAVQDTSANDAGCQISHETQWSEADYEKHFNEHDNPFARTALLPYGGIQKRFAKHLTVPDEYAAKSHASSDTSLQSRSQTPIFQQLYLTMTNWERIVANTADFQKIRNFRKFCKTKRAAKDFVGGESAFDELSDASSVDFTVLKKQKSKTSSHQSLVLKKRHRGKLTKSSSLGSVSQLNSTSEDEQEYIVEDFVDGGRAQALRPVSAPPNLIKPIRANAKDLDADSQNEGAATTFLSGLDTETESDDGAEPMDNISETPYIPVIEEDFGQQIGEQIEELADENKSLIWCLVKQVRPGMDLSKVVLPTFILEPRSFLDKLSDSYYHSDFLSRAVLEEDHLTRMKLVVKWYLSGFYKKPKGLKKPYNPVLGETFRCYWAHSNGSRSYYIAEQVSHHPPVSAFYVTNRQDGFSVSCSILAKSKFYGNSTSAVLEGVATLTLLPRGECYTLSSPYAHCKGILMGTLSMELGGKIHIECENTGYSTELDFKLKPFLGGSDSTNIITGKIRLGKETLATINGHWDSEIRIKDAKSTDETVLFVVNEDTKKKRLTRYVVPIEAQNINESERLWMAVSAAIRREDQIAATEEKTVLEEAQRNDVKERRATLVEWHPRHFQQDLLTGQWIYKYADLRPWDPRNDVKQYETDYKVLTKTRHLAPMVRTSSIVSVDRFKNKQRHSKAIAKLAHDVKSDSSQSDDINKKPITSKSIQRLAVAIDHVNKALEDHTRQLAMIHSKLERMQYTPQSSMTSYSTMRSTFPSSSSSLLSRMPATIPQTIVVKSIIFAFVGIFACLCLKWLNQ